MAKEFNLTKRQRGIMGLLKDGTVKGAVLRDKGITDSDLKPLARDKLIEYHWSGWFRLTDKGAFLLNG